MIGVAIAALWPSEHHFDLNFGHGNVKHMKRNDG